jgi:hypothetical protein
MITTTNLLIALLVPLLVSFVSFKVLHSRAKIKGKTISSGIFQGIQFDLGGAFAAYVIVAGGILYFFSWQIRRSDEQVWLVKGSLKFATQSSSINPLNVSIVVEPPNRVLDDGTFDFSIIRNTKDLFPKIKLAHQGFTTKIVHFDEQPGKQKYSITFDEDKRLILIQDPIILEPTN